MSDPTGSIFGGSNVTNHAGKVHTGQLDRYIKFEGALCRQFLQFRPWLPILRPCFR